MNCGWWNNMLPLYSPSPRLMRPMPSYRVDTLSVAWNHHDIFATLCFYYRFVLPVFLRARQMAWTSGKTSLWDWQHSYTHRIHQTGTGLDLNIQTAEVEAHFHTFYFLITVWAFMLPHYRQPVLITPESYSVSNTSLQLAVFGWLPMICL